MLSFLKLIRYPNLIMVSLILILCKYALIHPSVKEGVLTLFQFSVLVVSVLCITAGGYIINDLFDIEADKINKPNKTFINVSVSKKNAWISYVLFTIIGIILGTYLSFLLHKEIYSLIFISTAISLFLYAKYLKRIAFIGNFLVAFLAALTVCIVYIFEPLGEGVQKSFLKSIGNAFRVIFIYIITMHYAIFSFLTTLIREMIKDIEDVNGDKKLHMKTLPILLGRKRAKKIVFIISFLFLIFLVFIIKNVQEEFLILFIYAICFILVPLGYFLHRLWNATAKKDYSVLSKLLKVIMLSGILSMLFFKFK